MNRMNMYQPSYALPRDPGTAALLSIVPGLGQLYNGEKRKGVLFLDVAAINFTILWVMLFTDPIIKAMKSFGQAFHVQPNKVVIESLQAAHIGSPLSIIVLGLIVTFAAYAVRDAYDRANVTRKRSIYPESVVEMPEATSGSYLFHAAAMISLFILALFFVQPVKQTKTMMIEFVHDQPEVQEEVDAHRVSDKDSKNKGKVNPEKRVTPTGSQAQQPQPERHQSSQPPAPVPRQPVRNSDAPVPVPQPPRQIAMATPAKPVHVAPAQPVAPPMPTQTAPQPVAPTVTPHVSVPAVSAAPPVPQAPLKRTLPITPGPTLPVKTSAPNPTLPTPMPLTQAIANLPAAVVQPIKMANAGTASSVPVPVAPRGQSSAHVGSTALAPMTFAAGPSAPMGGPVPVAPGHSANQATNSGATAAPGPSRIENSRSGSSGQGNPVAVAPRPGTQGRNGQPGTTTANDDPHAPGSLEAKKSVDFGAYMNELQRRIKRNWTPPTDGLTKRVMVIFTITPGGQLLNLRLERTSGLATADNAALRAVELAAPFARLPAGADGNVDIQFTFDYNVIGGGRGTFRRF